MTGPLDGDASTPRRDASTPRRDASTPRRDASTPRRDASTPRRDASTPPADVAEVARVGAAVQREVSAVVVGKDEVVRLAVICLLTQGHLLIEDVPGTGKTSLAKALARAAGAEVSRVQFTPDLMPSDVTGVSVYDRHTSQFVFRPGPVFANVVVADEINRASPKTQSALLEAMEERQVSVDGTTYRLARPFLVLATQNPVEMEGTYPLPEAQRDRFLAHTSLGYPALEAELALVADREGADPLLSVRTVTSAERLASLIRGVESVHVAEAVRRYVVLLVRATRGAPGVRLGASPRATLHLMRAARARAALAGREFVVPDDVAALAVPVLAHRLLLDAGTLARAGRDVGPGTSSLRTARESVVRDVLGHVPVPRGGRA